jgi:hypothetical protein
MSSAPSQLIGFIEIDGDSALLAASASWATVPGGLRRAMTKPRGDRARTLAASPPRDGSLPPQAPRLGNQARWTSKVWRRQMRKHSPVKMVRADTSQLLEQLDAAFRRLLDQWAESASRPSSSTPGGP